MGEFSLAHWIVVLIILLLFFGPSKLPGLGASLGKAIRGFKSGLNEADPNERSAQNSRPEQIESTTNTSAQSENSKAKDPQHKS